MVTYIVQTPAGYLTFIDQTGNVETTDTPEDAAMFSRVGVVRAAAIYKGVAYSYNTDTRKLRQIRTKS